MTDPASNHTADGSPPAVCARVHAWETLLLAWDRIEEKDGGPGVDGVTLDDFELRLDEELQALGRNLRDLTYRPQPLLRAAMPKPGGGTRMLAIPTVRNRVLHGLQLSLDAEKTGSPTSIAGSAEPPPMTAEPHAEAAGARAACDERAVRRHGPGEGPRGRACRRWARKPGAAGIRPGDASGDTAGAVGDEH